ncbi:MAG TPA: signal peptidase I [Candidatus Latescibacteria bacterium]|nr:signal peptidase I [Candidatus Latescibacterota bacterium]
MFVLAAVVLGLVVVRIWFLQGYTIVSRSMEDTLWPGDSVIVEKSTHLVETGEVILFQSPEDSEHNFLKRCIAVAGQRVEIRDKVVFIDGERLPDPRFSKYLDARILPPTRGERDNLSARIVPPGHLFVMGDNRDNSRDSRHWGFLSTEALMGRAVRIYFSAEPAAEGMGLIDRLTSLAGRIRWQRLGSEVR